MSDWSSDVCSSDLDAVVFDHRVGEQLGAHRVEIGFAGAVGAGELDAAPRAHVRHAAEPQPRPDERRVGKESVSTCRSRWSLDSIKKSTYTTTRPSSISVIRCNMSGAIQPC